MTLTDTLTWFAIAILQWGIYSSVYKENAFYDIAEGLALGATAGISVMDNLNNANSLILLPLQNNFSTYWWVIFSVILGLLYFTVYIKRAIEVFRLVTIFVLSIEVGLLARTYASAGWAQVTGVAKVLNFNSLVVWILCIGGFCYFIFSRKLEKPFRIPREFGRWVMIFEIGVLLTPMFLRYVEGGINWQVQINASPAWMVPFVVFAVVLVDALNGKYGFYGKKTAAQVKT